MRVRPLAALLTTTLVAAALAATSAAAAPATAPPARVLPTAVATPLDDHGATIADGEATALPPPAPSGSSARVAGSLMLSGPSANLVYQRVPGVPVPRPIVRLPTAVDAEPPYVPAKTCGATTAKPGALALRALLMKTYVGSGDDGIVSSCVGSPFTSEHMEGRAFDWKVSVRVPAQKAQAETFLAWLTANNGVNARRLGVMYAIWDAKIWGVYSASSGWRTYSCSGETGCHRDHVHLSMTWDGAYKRTSFWSGRAVTVQDYGPCVRNGAYFASVGSASTPNHTPCPTWLSLAPTEKVFATLRANANRTVSLHERSTATVYAMWILGGEQATGRSTALTGQHLAAFQLRRGLNRTGTITPQTWRSLADYASAGKVRIP